MSEGGVNVLDMEAVAWSAIGLLGATLAVLTGALLTITGRIQVLGDGLRDKIEEQGGELRDRIDEQGRLLTERIEEQGRETRERIDGLGSRLDQHIGRHAG